VPARTAATAAATVDAPSPARLFASMLGWALVVAGIVGFFYSASFGSPGQVDEALGAFAVNGWSNLLYIATGALGLLVAGFAARAYALWIGGLYVALAIWGLALGGDGDVLGLLPVNTADAIAYLAVGTLGLLAAKATPGARRPDPPPVSSERTELGARSSRS
jgi:Domain of unknown function (DUF4383)